MSPSASEPYNSPSAEGPDAEDFITDPDDALTLRQRVSGLFSIVAMTARAAPLAVVLTVVGAVADAALPLLTTWFAAGTTTALAQAWAGTEGALEQAMLLIGLTAGTGLVTVVWSSVAFYIREKLSFVVAAKISDQMIERFASLDFWRYEDKATGDLFDRASRFAKGFAMAFDKIAGVFSSAVTALGAVVALVFVNPWLALAVSVALVPGVWLQFRLTRKLYEHWSSTVAVRRRQSGIEQRMLHPRSIVELRLFGLVRHLLQLRSTLRNRDERERLEMERSYILKRLIADLVEAITQLGALVWVTLQIAARSQPIGQFVFVQQVVSRAIESTNSFVTAMADVDQDIVNVFDYVRLLNIEPGRKRSVTAPEITDEIEVSGVSFRYPGPDRPIVLDDVSLTIPVGSHVAIVGANGAGKTTLVKLLLGIFDPVRGQIRLDGVSLADVELVSWHRQVAVLRQDFVKFSIATIRENVHWGDPDRPIDDAEIWRALELAEAADFVRALPQGLDTFVDPWLDDEEGEVGTELSGGQWQRLALARAFYRNARVLILDEPTSAMDAAAEATIFERLAADRQRTIVTISHRLVSVAQADRIYVLADGRLVESGTHAELVARNGAYVRLFASQLRSPLA